MSDNFECQEIKPLIEELKKTARQFNAAYGEVLAINNFRDAESKFQMQIAEGCMAHLIDVAAERLGKLMDYWQPFVKNAVNPYHEGLSACGLTDPSQNPETYDEKMIALWRMLNHDDIAYTNANLYLWSDSLINCRPYESKFSWKQFRLIKDQLKDGAIPIFMPGREAQLKDLKKALEWLRPDAFVPANSGEEFTIKAAEIQGAMEHYINVGDEQLVKDIPESPYVIFIKPSLRPQSREEYARQKQQTQESIEDIEGASAGSIRLCEYLSLQNRYTDRLRDMSDEDPRSVVCLDLSSVTFFDDLPHTVVPNFEFCPGARMWSRGENFFIQVSSFDVKDAAGGYRLGVRVELSVSEEEAGK